MRTGYFYALTALILSLLSGCQKQPLDSLQKAKGAVEAASKAGALKYQADRYHKLEELLESGRQEMARQNGRLAPLRNYQAADSIFHVVTVSANNLSSSVTAQINQLRSNAETKREDFQEELKSWREALDGSLTIYNAEKYWSSADLALQMSKNLMANHEYKEAIEALDKGHQSLENLSEVLAEYDNDASQKIKVWRKWVDQTIEESRRDGKTAIIVDKSKHKLYLIKSGKVVHVYSCELGYNSARQKFFSGDGATPEGRYRVTKARQNGSKFYKALLVDYPNQTDKNRFAENKRKGVISDNARIGGLIEIHGWGGQNKDWTDGCVALTNQEMDQLMQICIGRHASNYCQEIGSLAMKRLLLGLLVVVLVIASLSVMLRSKHSTPEDPLLFSDSTIAPLPADVRTAQKDLKKARTELARYRPSGAYIVVNTHANKVYLRTADSILVEGDCSTGTGAELVDSTSGRHWVFDTPRGSFKVTTKLKEPWWRKPDWAYLEEGETVPKNEQDRLDPEMMGAYAIGFGDGFYIHGTIYERLLGISVTHGCVRVGADDLKNIYDKVRIGTPIYIF